MTTPTSKPSIVALIPARAGSKRVPGKNVKPMGGKPLICWTIQAAIDSGIFTEIHVSTDSRATLGLVQQHFPYRTSSHLRPEGLSNDDTPDICWVESALESFYFDAFAILRPTSPFRTAETIQRAWAKFLTLQPCDSIRAVQPVKEHPSKMWHVNGPDQPMDRLQGGSDYLGDDGLYVPAHSRPTQSLWQRYYVQNASLEIAWTRVVTETRTISGTRIMPFFTQGLEGFDINTPDDWIEAEYHMAERQHPIEYLG